MRTGFPDAQRLPAQEPMTTAEKADAPIEQIPITKARSMIGRLVNRVHVGKERIVLEKGGMPVAALIDIDEFKQFMAFREAAQAK
jgi:prevent-host-death family protein